MGIRTRSIYRTDDDKGHPNYRRNNMSHTGNSTTIVASGISATDLDAEAITVDFVYSDAAITTGITAVIQSSHDGGANYDHTHGTVTIVAKTATRHVVSIDLNMKRAGDQSELPLRPQIRIAVIGTNAADTVTLDEIHVSSRSRS